MRLANKEIIFALNKETFQPEIHLTVAVPLGPLAEDGKRESDDDFYRRIGKQLVELLPLTKSQLDSLRKDL